MAFSLTNILEMFQKSGGGSVLGVDIGSSAIKLVQLRKKGGQAVLETYGALSLGPYANVNVGRATRLPPPAIAEALTDLIREAKVTTKDSGVAVPLSASLISFMRLPAADSARLAAMIPIEARKYVPVPITEVSLDWWIVPGAEGREDDDGAPASRGTVNVLMVAIHNDALEKYRTIASTAKLETSFYELEVFSAIRAVIDRTLAALMVFDMGAASTKLSIIEGGILQYSHTVNRGSQDLTLAASQALNIPVEEAERLKRTVGLSDPSRRDLADSLGLSLDHIFTETNRAIASYAGRTEKAVSRIILTGGGVLLRGFLDLARERLEAEVTLGNPFAKVRAPAFLEPLLATAGPEFSVALGLALRKLHELA